MPLRTSAFWQGLMIWRKIDLAKEVVRVALARVPVCVTDLARDVLVVDLADGDGTGKEQEMGDERWYGAHEVFELPGKPQTRWGELSTIYICFVWECNRNLTYMVDCAILRVNHSHLPAMHYRQHIFYTPQHRRKAEQ